MRIADVQLSFSTLMVAIIVARCSSQFWQPDVR